MKKIFTITVEYPDNDVIPSDEVIEAAQECIEQHMERYFGANIMDGDYDRIHVKEVTNGFPLVKRMREAQKQLDTCSIGDYAFRQHCAAQLESEVDEYLKNMEK